MHPYPDCHAESSFSCTLPQLWPPAPAQVWSQQGKVYVPDSLKSWAIIDLSWRQVYALDSLEPWAVMDLPDVRFFVTMIRNCHRTCQFSVCYSVKHDFPSISVACSLTAFKYLIKYSFFSNQILTYRFINNCKPSFFIFPYGHILSNNFPNNDSLYMLLLRPYHLLTP